MLVGGDDEYTDDEYTDDEDRSAFRDSNSNLVLIDIDNDYIDDQVFDDEYIDGEDGFTVDPSRITSYDGPWYRPTVTPTVAPSANKICPCTHSCSSGGYEGACISISQGCCSSGTVTSGLCPGGSDIKCCTKSACSTPYGSGTCLSTSMCTGTSIPGYCSGPPTLKCCVPTPATRGVDTSEPPLDNLRGLRRAPSPQAGGRRRRRRRGAR